LLRRTLGEGITLRIGLAPENWPALTDAHQLENAILNLAINARDAMPRGGTLSITTSREILQHKERFGQEEIEAGDYVVVCIGDTGVGMSAETLTKVFEPFAAVVMLAGALMAFAFGFMWLIAMYQLWFAAPPAPVADRSGGQKQVVA